MLRDFCVAHGIPLKDVILSPSTINEIRKEVESSSALRIKVSEHSELDKSIPIHEKPDGESKKNFAIIESWA